jgi:hypothetical protein
VKVNATAVESGEGICADAEERVYIQAGHRVKGLGIYFHEGRTFTVLPKAPLIPECR